MIKYGFSSMMTFQAGSEILKREKMGYKCKNQNGKGVMWFPCFRYVYIVPMCRNGKRYAGRGGNI